MSRRVFAFITVALLLTISSHAYAAARTQGVYVNTIEGMKADMAQTATKVESALKGAGFTVLASFENGAPEGCKYRAMTIVFTNEAYAARVISGGPDKGFALPLRVSLYEDARGLNVAVMNPVSVNRTIFQNGSMDEPAQKVVDEVAAALKSVGPVSAKQIGQLRDDGSITGMGGGPFPEKVVPVAASNKSLAEMADALVKGITDKNGWHAIYTYKPSEGVVIVGVTNRKTEGRAFGIAGESRATSANKFPGLDHASAFPVEIVIYKKGAHNTASILKEMWRMKLYFQDAGNWAFMKNMGMPGDIQSQIEAAIKKFIK